MHGGSEGPKVVPRVKSDPAVYHPRLDLTDLCMEMIKDINDAQVPTGQEIEQRFVEHVNL